MIISILLACNCQFSLKANAVVISALTKTYTDCMEGTKNKNES